MSSPQSNGALLEGQKKPFLVTSTKTNVNNTNNIKDPMKSLLAEKALEDAERMKNGREEPTGFDAVLERVGSFGPWQKRVFFFASLTQIFTAIHSVAAVFLSATPDHYCQVPGLDDEENPLTEMARSASHELHSLFKNISIPRSSGCEYYLHDYTSLLPQLNTTLTAGSPWHEEQLQPHLRNATATCHKWFFDDSTFQSTVVSEWSLVCDRRWLGATVQASYMSGLLFGSLFSGQISDSYGRRTTVIGSILISVVVATVSCFVEQYALFLALRFIIAAMGAGCMVSGFVLIMEVVSPDARSATGMLNAIPFGLGIAIVPLYAYFIRDWRNLQLAFALSSSIMLGNYWLLPESPRWLVSKGRINEALHIVRDMARDNGKPVPNDHEILGLLHQEQLSLDGEGKQVGVLRGVLDMFKAQLILVQTPKLRRRCLISFFVWLVAAMVYYGLTFSGSNINANLFLIMAVSGLAEIPSICLTIVMLKRFGRRLTMCSLFLICGVFCLIILAVPREYVYVNFTLAMLGKFFNTSVFQLCYIYTSELTPTSVRNVAVGTSSMFARVGSSTAPYIVDLLGALHFAVPSTVFGALSLAAGFLTLMLPETNNTMLPETVEDVESSPR